MKNKKILTAICSVAMAATLGLTAFAGCNKEEHSYTWTVEVEETCSSEGKRTGVCGICGDVKEETIPVDPAKHAYGEWQIDQPTEETEGKATRVCSHNTAHTEEVTLPKITSDGAGYLSSEVTTQPTVISEGVRTVVLATENGNIEFKLVIPKKEVTTVADAVLLGSSLGNMIRSTSGTYSESEASGLSKSNKFSAEFGDNYTHVTDEGQKTQSWYSLDDAGVPFGVYVQENRIPINPQDPPEGWEPPEGYIPDSDMDFITELSDPKVVENVTESHLKGYGYSTATNNIRGYGAEDLLSKYYSMAQTARGNNKAVNYVEHFSKASNGEVTADFSFGFYENPNFARYKIEFTLYPQGAIKTLRMDTKLIRSYMIANDKSDPNDQSGNKLFDDKGDIIFAEEYDFDRNTESYLYETEADGKTPVISGVKTDAAGNVLHDSHGEEIPRYKPLGRDNRKYYSDDHDEVNNKTLIYNEQVLKTDNDVVPENPYKSDVLYIKSFDAKYNGKTLGENAVELPTNTAVYIDIDNVLPTTATLDYDPLRLYVKQGSQEYELKQSGNFSDNPFSIIGSYLKDDKKVVLNSRYATKSEDDYITLIMRTYGGKCEKQVKLLFEKGAPSTIIAQAYSYSDSSGKPVYAWSEYSESNHAKIYVGQPLYIRAVAAPDEQGFADTSFTASVRGGGITFTNKVDFEGEKVTRLVASAAGTYQIALRYDKAGGEQGEGKSFAYLWLDVEAAPALSGVFTGEYETSATLKIGGASIPNVKMNVTLSYTTDWHQGEIEFAAEGNSCKYRYSVGADNKIALTLVGSVPNETFEFSLALNEAYKLELTHKTGVRDLTETIVLSRPQ